MPNENRQRSHCDQEGDGQAIQVVTPRMDGTGLAGRTLMSWASPRRIFFDARGPSRQDSVTSEQIIPSDQISETLPEIVKTLTQPLYETFDFYDIPSTVVREELSRMRGVEAT
jgi:hypothetical protein